MERYEEFKKELKKELERWLGPKYRIKFDTVIKNNGVKQDSILIQQWEKEQETTISLAPYWDLFCRGDGMQRISSEFLSYYESEKNSVPYTAAQLLDFTLMRDRVVYRLINADLNHDLLTQVPHIPFLDLAIVFSLQLWSGEDCQMNCLIDNHHLQNWGIAPEILYPLSVENTPRLLPLQFRHICDVIGLPELEDEPLIREPKMYVLTNQTEVCGAAALLYPDALKEASDKLDSDLLIIPSSIHEVLLVPMTDLIDEMDFEAIVREINDDDVAAEDILSYRIYQYDRKTEQVTIFKSNENSGGKENGAGARYQ